MGSAKRASGRCSSHSVSNVSSMPRIVGPFGGQSGGVAAVAGGLVHLPYGMRGPFTLHRPRTSPV
ncbi:hypothetical protein TSOC_001057 [Tetrabaena socialis]|uniref:Uncharacterized protein n=1 Tax=Tetrabaena socialis TaxID=47790 RepID=A0A2J8AHM9_9CHLO|nr:hypothetical protein TSOC_001057 [Tetrabaena socialis]|eukprot:PNH12035.1 hypothetical protein TSOC_001057 [Tetrabaena socialis]